MKNTESQIPRRISHAKKRAEPKSNFAFDYSLNYKIIDMRKTPNLYRVGRSEEGVLLVEPYKSELLPLWRFKTPEIAAKSSHDLRMKFEFYKAQNDFVGMDMARKFIQMGFTRSRRYANHKSGRKYDSNLAVLPDEIDFEKAESAEIFFKVWKEIEADEVYADMKMHWKFAFG